MRYYEEMRTKYGFEDGEAVPPDSEVVRELLVEAINAGLKKRGNFNVEAYAYDRFGAHNWCLLLYREIDSTEEDDLSEPDAVEAILAHLEEHEYLDQCYSITIEKSPEASQVLEQLMETF
jgi:hypothetical protein